MKCWTISNRKIDYTDLQVCSASRPSWNWRISELDEFQEDPWCLRRKAPLNTYYTHMWQSLYQGVSWSSYQDSIMSTWAYKSRPYLRVTFHFFWHLRSVQFYFTTGFSMGADAYTCAGTEVITETVESRLSPELAAWFKTRASRTQKLPTMPTCNLCQ